MGFWVTWNSTFNLLVKLPNCFPTVAATFYVLPVRHEDWISPYPWQHLLFSIFIIIVILMHAMYPVPIHVLINDQDAEHLFMCLLICVFSLRTVSSSPLLIFEWGCLALLMSLRILISWILISYQAYDWEILLLRWLSFHFLIYPLMYKEFLILMAFNYFIFSLLTALMPYTQSHCQIHVDIFF